MNEPTTEGEETIILPTINTPRMPHAPRRTPTNSSPQSDAYEMPPSSTTQVEDGGIANTCHGDTRSVFAATGQGGVY